MPRTPLPVLGLVGDSLRDVFGRLGGLGRIAWPYYALAALAAIAGVAPTGGSRLGDRAASLLGPGTAQLLAGLAVLACTVRWQRHVILGEELRGTAPLDGRVLRYAWRSLVLGLLCAVPVLVAGAVGVAVGLVVLDPQGAAPFRVGVPAIALLVAGVVAAVLLFVRLAPALPAVSVGDGTLGLRRSWRLTRGHGLRLLAALVLLALGVALLGALGGLLEALMAAVADVAGDGGPGRTVVWAAGGGLQAGLDLVSAMLGASLVARVYRHLASAPDTAQLG